jgi:hypothetical protein
VVAVIRGVDMRPKHDIRATFMRRVGVGQVVVLINGDAKMARLIDHEGGVHDYYAPDGVKFDEAALYNMVERGTHILLNEGNDTVHRHQRIQMA